MNDQLMDVAQVARVNALGEVLRVIRINDLDHLGVADMLAMAEYVRAGVIPNE